MRGLLQRGNWLPLLLIGGMATVLYSPVLFLQKSQVHAEGVSLGVALMHMLATGLHGETSILWTTGIYGGHPVFAEGQGGFASPLHLMVAWLFPAVQGYNIHQFLSMVISGVGAYGMCRVAGCGRAASTFAALALIFSTLWIGGRSNLAVGSTMSWIPWVFWAQQRWRQRADVASACFFGSAVALMVVSGYPQLVHGVLVYLTIVFMVQLASRQERKLLRPRLKPLITTLALAILLSVGLSAVQWLPLLELAAASHRSAGIAIGGLDGAPPIAFFRGFLYTLADPDGLPDAAAGKGLVYFAALGSLLACLVSSSILLFRRNAQINAHIIATLFLVFLSFGNRGLPLFELLYDYHLIPGLHNFRVVFVYLYVALVGCCLLSAMALDKMAGYSWRAPAAGWRGLMNPGGSVVLFPAVWLCAWLLCIWYLHVDEVHTGQYFLAATWLACVCLAPFLGVQKSLPSAALLLLCMEIFAFRMNPFEFGDASLIARPKSIISLEAEGNLADYKFADRNWANIYSLYPPKSSHVIPGLARLLESVTPAANVLWGVASLTGNTALDLKRRRLADPLIEEELRYGNKRIPGLRLIDFVSLKYLSVGPAFDNPGFRQAYANDELNVRFVENTYAYPRFQFFYHALFVPNMEAAVTAIEQLRSRTLVIEADSAAVPKLGGVPAALSEEPGYQLIKDNSGHYELAVHTPAPVWLFLADANYPGWHAYVDGRETPVYSAQLLGKAVYLPAGNSRLEIAFEPASFRWGLAVTVASLCLMALFLFRHRQHRP